MSMKAIVKSVLSGDSLLLRGRPGPQGQLPKERILNLADISAPRMGNSSREDEVWAFESREFLRALAVGKEITFVSTHSLPPNDDTQRDFGFGEIGGLDVTTELLSNGWAKVNERKREPTEDDHKRKDLETEAKNAGKGIWNPHGPKAYTVNHTMPADSQGFLTAHKGESIDAIIEQVRDGSTVRARLLLPDDNLHQMVNISMTGVRSPKASSKQGEPAEQWGDEARFFTESRVLQRMVKVVLVSMPAPGPSPFQQSAGDSTAHTASIYIGNVIHPNGNIAEHLLSAGLARVVDWHAGMVGGPGMERLRAAEKAAKERRLCIYASGPAALGASGKTPGSTAVGNGLDRAFEATVIRIWSGDQMSVSTKSGKERRLQLSSIRAPRGNDPKQAFYAAEAKEYLRKRLIGKIVNVHVDFIRPAEGEFEERECATVKFGRQHVNIGEQLIEKGLATALRHKKDDENRSPDYDKLIIAEKAAVDGTRGMHSGTEQTLDLEMLPRILLPKENQTLTLALAGIRAPRNSAPPGRASKEKPEPYGPEAAEFSTRRYMQRDVEIQIETVDKTGGFIGALYLDKTENAAIELVREGLATVHSYSAETLPWSQLLIDAEAEAKSQKKNLWSDYDPEAENAKTNENDAAADSAPLKAEYMDVIISDIRSSPSFGFSVQILNTEGIASLEKLMRDFSLHHRSAIAPKSFVPQHGQLVSAKFSDGSWYRAKIRRSSTLKKEAEVTFIDYGNQDTISFKDIRPLDSQFASLPGQAQDARLSFVKLVDPTSEYGPEAMDRFRSLCESRKLVANVDHREGSLLHLRLIDPASQAAADDPSACINVDLVRDGLASLDRKGCRYAQSYPTLLNKIRAATDEAKRDRMGMFEFGDVEEDE